MLASIALATLSLSAPAPSAPWTAPPALLQEDDAAKEKEFDERLTQAGEDVEQLLELSEWCKENDLRAKSREVLARVLEIAPDNEPAHKGLRHHFYDDQWFESYAALSAYRREEARRKLEEEGLVRHGEDWVPQEDLPFLRMGWVKDEGGTWSHPADLELAKLEAQRLEEGWKQQQDMVWVSPEEFSKWEEGLVKCGDQWLDNEAATAYHAEIGQWWTLPGNYFVALSTCDWGVTVLARDAADQTYRDLTRAVGLRPESKPKLLVLRSLAQYNRFAAGDQAAGLPTTEFGGFSSVHYSYFAEAWLDRSVTPPRYQGGGVTYWDAQDPGAAPFGPLGARHAAAHSYIEAVDPSWNVVSQVVSNPNQQVQLAAFWAEKRIPAWFRYGLAMYVERYMQDRTVADGGDPWHMRHWALQQLRDQGGPRPIEEVFAFRMDVNDPGGTGKLYTEAGMLLSFILDGNCRPVVEKHQAFKEALRTGGDSAQAVADLQQAILDSEDDLRLYANF